MPPCFLFETDTIPAVLYVYLLVRHKPASRGLKEAGSVRVPASRVLYRRVLLFGGRKRRLVRTRKGYGLAVLDTLLKLQGKAGFMSFQKLYP